MGLIIDAQPEHGDWRLELRRESFYLTSVSLALRVHRTPAAIRVPLATLDTLAEVLTFVARSEHYRQRPDMAGAAAYETTIVGGELELRGPMLVYSDDWQPATIEPTYADLPALRSAVHEALKAIPRDRA